MEIFKWYKKYSVNNEELDNHHKALFDILNRLFENCLSNNAVNCLESVADELISYADYHFTAEEKYMRDIGYEDIDKQISEHEYFTQKALELKQVINKNDYELTKEFTVSLLGWILKHVTEEDKKYSVKNRTKYNWYFKDI